MNKIHNNLQETNELEILSQIDLNLIVAFDILMREQSVTRAAEQMGVTQSAMSHTLRRLRDLLNDPLLVRGRGGMQPTPRATSLMIPLRSSLVTLSRTLTRPNTFEASCAKRTFRIASPDLFDGLILPPLLKHLQKEARGINFAFLPPGGQNISDHLETGEIDIAVMAIPQWKDSSPELERKTDAGLLRRTVLHDSFVCFLRKGHPILSSRNGSDKTHDKCPFSLDDFISLSHLLVSPDGKGAGIVDRALEKHGVTRRIVLRIPHFHTAPALIATSDLILTAPSALSGLTSALPLCTVPAPISLPKHTINLVWHQRFSNDPGHRWLRELLVGIASKLFT